MKFEIPHETLQGLIDFISQSNHLPLGWTVAKCKTLLDAAIACEKIEQTSTVPGMTRGEKNLDNGAEVC